MACKEHKRRCFLLFLLASATGACAAVSPVNPAGPRRNEPPYPIILTANPQRSAAAEAAWAQLLNQKVVANQPAIALQPVTATIKNLPANLGTPLYLPKVGNTASPADEDQTREALRRFLNQSQKLIGADPAQLSLVQQTASSDGTQLVVYEQRPFRYPLRGPYGKIELRFSSDRRVLSLSSTAVPEADKIQAALSVVKPAVKEEELQQKVAGQTVSYTGSDGVRSTYTISAAAPVNARQLVVYPVLESPKQEVLEFHLAWEVALENAPISSVFVDALTGDIIGASPS